MDMPSPVTVVTREEVSIIAPTNLVEGLAELPQFYGSNTTQNPGNFFVTEGAGSLNLRGLQSKRTLQLLNGRRVVQSTIFGGPDINLFPENVISSVETVTGGASAAYGTDAVAGAVNFILDTDFEGFRANVSGGANDKGHGDHYEASFGAGFALGEKTHLLVSLERSEQDPIGGSKRSTTTGIGPAPCVKNTAAGAGTTPDNPAFVPYDQVRTALSASLDGILYLPAAAGGDQILDANGTPSPFVFGTPCACNTRESWVAPPSTAARAWTTVSRATQISPDSGRENIFAYIEHDFGDLTVYGQLISGEAEFTSPGNAGLFRNPPGAAADRSFTIFSGNPFLPASIQPAMTAKQSSRRCCSAASARWRTSVSMPIPADHRDGFPDGRFRVRVPAGMASSATVSGSSRATTKRAKPTCRRFSAAASASTGSTSRPTCVNTPSRSADLQRLVGFRGQRHSASIPTACR